MTRIFSLAALLALAAGPALAHTGHGSTDGFVSGFTHPIGGLDHVLAMVTVGILAASLGGRGRWLVPASFVGMMLAGGALGMSGVEVPFVELGILGSVVVLGAAVALGKPRPLGLVMALAGLFAVFHGHAHGAEMPGDIGVASYALGFAVATAVLHGAGIGLGLLLGRYPAVTRLAGGAVAVAGVAMFVG